MDLPELLKSEILKRGVIILADIFEENEILELVRNSRQFSQIDKRKYFS